jgi:hypothetical protein
MLRNDEVVVFEVAYKVGFSSPAYFNTCFHEFFGYPQWKVKKGDSSSTEEKDNVQVVVNQKLERAVRRNVIFISSGTAFLAVLVFLVYIFFIKNSSAMVTIPVNDHEKSIAVLPLKNLSDTLSNQYFIVGIMEEILTDLSRMHDLRVISRTSVEQFHGSGKSAREIGKNLM